MYLPSLVFDLINGKIDMFDGKFFEAIILPWYSFFEEKSSFFYVSALYVDLLVKV